MNNADHILLENKAYWSNRAASYSDVSKWELNGESKRNWSMTLIREIDRQINRPHNSVHILEVGTGPGFFAILLASAGYQVTAIDLTPNMLAEARQNAKNVSSHINFMEMNAEKLDFEASSFDVVLSRNLTWNLPHPKTAYSEWCRVLKKDGLLLNFDANWYRYLFDKKAKEIYEQDRLNTAKAGYEDQNIGENFDIMENIAKKIPLSQILRPKWDKEILSKLGMYVEADESVWQKVWTTEEQTSFASTPMFMIKAWHL